MRERRIKNYNYLYCKLSKIKQIQIPFKLDYGIVPFGFVILTQKRDELYKYCIKNNIYCNIHWEDTANELSKTILTIPCDQRYKSKEMKYIVKKIKKFFGRR